MELGETLLLTREDVGSLLGIEECTAAVEAAFRAYGEGRAQRPGILGVHAPNGGFHIKAGIMDLGRSYFVAKMNANFPGNHLEGLPTIQGVIVVSDASNGRLLAVMDSIEITIIRTGAATAVATKYLARTDARTALICGCGQQGRVSLNAILNVRDLDRVFAYDIDPKLAENFANDLSAKLQVNVEPTRNIEQAAQASDIIVTCTTSSRYFLQMEYVSPGTFIAAVGADSEEKQELDPQLLADSKIVTDITAQCSSIGELRHAIRQGTVTLDNVFAELGEIVAGAKPGRTNDDEIVVFDSTGMALQDVASAAIVYERASAAGHGARINFNDEYTAV